MSMFDSILSTAVSSFANNQQGQQSGNYIALINALVGIMNQQGGVSGLVEKFQANGLGDLVQSWVSSGQNLPVSADQVKSVLGEGTLQDLSAATGQDTGGVAHTLSSLLPEIVNQLTPHGSVPQGGFDATAALSIIQKMFLK